MQSYRRTVSCVYVTLIKHLYVGFLAFVCVFVCLSSRHCFRSGPSWVPEMLWSSWTSTTLISMSENMLLAVSGIWGKHMHPPTQRVLYNTGAFSVLLCLIFKLLHLYHPGHFVTCLHFPCWFILLWITVSDYMHEFPEWKITSRKQLFRNPPLMLLSPFLPSVSSHQ